MPRPELMFFTLEQADTHIREPNYASESDQYVFEFVPEDNPADDFMDEEDWAHHSRGLRRAAH